MSVFKDKKSGKWIIKVRDLYGKQHWITVNKRNILKYGLPFIESSGKGIAKEVERVILEKSNGPNATPEAKLVSLSKAIKLYMETQMVSIHQKKRWQLVLKKYLFYFLGDKPVSEITMNDLERFKVYLSQGRSLATLRGYCIETKVFFKWAFKSGFMPKNPADDVKLPSHFRKPVECLTPEQVDQLLTAVRGFILEPAIIGFVNLGVRRSELTHIQWQHVNFEKKTVLIMGTKSNQAIREIPISDDFMKYLKAIKRRSEYVFTNEDGGKLSNWMLSSSLRRFVKRHLIDFHLTFQVLRKTYGSLLVRSGLVPIEYVAKFLGHNDVTTTQNWYVGLRGTDYAGKLSAALKGMV